jgi:hypothetical protein
MVFENPIQSTSGKALLTDYREMNDSFDILLNDFQLPEPGWVTRNPNKFVTIPCHLSVGWKAVDVAKRYVILPSISFPCFP